MRFLQSLMAVLFSIALAACGGGGGGGGAPATTYSISGTITGAASVTVTLSGASNATATTDGSGNYTFSGLANGNYVVTPSKATFVFNPISTAVPVSGANVTGKNFTASAAPVGTTYSISGTVSGAASSGVTITLGGTSSNSIVTGTGGTYTFSGLSAGNYTLTASLTGYTFTGPLTITGLAADSTGNNFTATAIPVAHSISGNVSGAGGSGVTITVTGTASATATTDGSGNYTVTGLYDGPYTVTPSKTGYTFNPTSTSVTMAGTNLTGRNFAGIANSAVTAPISGTVTGPWPEGVTITMSGGASGTTTTNASGAFSFPAQPSGQTYNFAASLPGYTFTTPAAVSIPGGSSTAVTVGAITQTSAVTAYTVSGTLSYAGTATGRVHVRLTDGACTSNCSAFAFTSLAAQGGTFTNVPFTIRGVKASGANGYKIRTFIDKLGNGSANSANPGVTQGTAFSVTNADVTLGTTLTLADQATPTPTAPTAAPSVFPGNGAALVLVSAIPTDASGREKASSYKIYWGTDVAASNGGSKTYPALGKDNDFFVLDGLTDGAAIYVKMTALVGATESAASPIAGPITIGALAGSNTLSGTVNFTGASAPMIVGAFNETIGVYFTRIASASNAQAFSITGIPNGTFRHFAVVDRDGNGRSDAGDPHNTNGEPPLVTLSGSGATSNLTLPSADATAVVQTSYWTDGSSSSYGLMLGTLNNTKRIAKSVLYSGKGVAVPADFDISQGANTYQSIGATVPVVGDQYKFRVTYYDNTTADLTATVTGVLNSANNLANNLAAAGAPNPVFTWTAPTTQPTYYGYGVSVWQNGTETWRYPQSDVLPSTTLTATYAGTALATGTYSLNIMVRDQSTGNSATRSVNFTAP